MTGLEIVRTCIFFKNIKKLLFKQLCERSKILTFQMLIGKIAPKTPGKIRLQISLDPTAVVTPPLIQTKERIIPYPTWLV